MFFHCETITYIDISTFNFKNSQDMSFMFSQSYKLTDINYGNLVIENVKQI